MVDVEDLTATLNKLVESSKINVKTIDDILSSRKINKVNMLKIDVEGFELEVVQGGLKTISKYKPAMLIESNNKDLSEKGPFWILLTSLESIGLYAKKVGEKKQLSIQQLTIEAKNALKKGQLISNYFYLFKS